MFRHIIRDCKNLEERLRGKKQINLPEECKHNSDVIYSLLYYAERAVPQLTNLSNEELRTMADAIAYVIRTDIIIAGFDAIGPIPHLKGLITPLENSQSIQKEIRLKNDPNLLTPEYVFPGVGKIPEGNRELEKQAAIGTYLGSYVWKIADWMGITKKFKYINDVTRVGDALAYLLDPRDLTDYKYSSEEIKNFHDVLEEQMREV